MVLLHSHQRIAAILQAAVNKAQKNSAGTPANYIPELAHVPLENTLAAIYLADGTLLTAGENIDYRFTLQSVAKMVLLAGLLQEYGERSVFLRVGMEPSGHDFSSITNLESLGPIPANPCINAGAIALCDHIPGDTPAHRIYWLDQWMSKIFEQPMHINQSVLESEKATGYRNSALAYLMKSNGVLQGDVAQALNIYFSLCSYEATIEQTARFAILLARGGVNSQGERILTKRTVRIVVSIMATCGLYNESGHHLLRTGLPAKSGVSGAIMAVAVGYAGIAVYSPRINMQGGSVRGHIMLEFLSTKLGWHFATL